MLPPDSIVGIGEASMALTTFGRPITLVSYFKCLGRFLLDSDNNCTVVIRNLQISRQKCVRILWLIGR